MVITGVILAAGMSSRMGAVNKLLLKYKDRTIIEETLTQMMNSGVDDVVIITGFESDLIEQVLASHTDNRTRFVYNADYRQGRAESIKCAIKAIAGKADAALFMVADKPGVNSHLIDKAIERFRTDRPAILYVEASKVRGHPIIFDKRVFDALLSLNGDRIGDELVSNYRDDLVRLVDDTPQIDIDSKDDYRILLETEGHN
ncbi:MAG: nucleotidyltransferase family protein [Candidatus Zixiibacteriota bacterium]|nr:MAG: nucleotidyltransferase family protein [candidate division Zixibacteria bacterium]